MSVGNTNTLWGRVVRYGIAGAAATVLYAGIVAALVELHVTGPVIAATIATCVVIVFSYFVNRRWIFETNRSHASAFGRFVLASGVGMTLNPGLMHLAVAVFAWPYWMGLILATAIVPPTNFALNQYWAFRPHQ